MRIIEIIVTGLFGIFDHAISLKVEDRITIIHGPNGFGKTILLKMLYGLFNSHYSELRNIPFQKFQVKFEDGSKVWVDKTPTSKQAPLFDDQEPDTNKNGRFTEVTVNFSKVNSTEPQSFSLHFSLKKGMPLSRLIDELPLERVGSDEWFFPPEGEIVTSDEILSLFGHMLPSHLREEPDWWLDIREQIKIHLIETQRLINIHEPNSPRRRRPKMVPVVEIYAEELADTIQAKLAESAALTQSLDRTFPARLVQQMGHSTLTPEELRDQLSGLETKRSRLKEAGILDKEEDMEFLPAEDIMGDAKDVLAVYVQDVEQKLGVFDNIAAKIDLLKEIINKRFLYNRMTVSKQNGFTFTLDKKPLPTTALSSGEQHELVLLYELLFKVQPNSLILIDEPELSLHVAWQKEFLQDLQKITQLASFDVLIATHSPQIIHDRWDLTVELKGPETL